MLLEIGMAVSVVGLYFGGKILLRSLGRRKRQQALDGELGIENQWAAELDQEGDQLFIIAANSLPDMELKEAGIVAESKQELREETVERFEQMSDEGLPEDFA